MIVLRCFCNFCLSWCHAKCNGINFKFIHELWFCASCKRETLPFESFLNFEETRVGADMSSFKRYFQQLNDIGISTANFQDVDEITSINCKYYDISKFL